MARWGSPLPMIVKILAAALLACLLTIGIQQWRIQLSNQRIITLQSAVLTFESAQTTNLATIAKLQRANDKWARDNAANLANAKVYTDAAMAFAKKQQAEADAAKAKLKAIYERQPDAKAWAAVALPASVARVLCETDCPH